MRYPGEVYYLERENGEPETKGKRPHVLLNGWFSRSSISTLAYCSTSGNDAGFGAEHVLIDPRTTSPRKTGLTRRTHVYPSRLISSLERTLGASAGTLDEELPALRDSLTRALGLGTGVTRESNVPGANRRGRLVELTQELADEWEVRYGVIVTEPEYSRFGYQQTLVPLLDDSFESTPLDLPLRETAWLKQLEQEYHNGFLAVPMVSTAFLPSYIAGFMDMVIPAELMEDLDRALRAYFQLETPAG